MDGQILNTGLDLALAFGEHFRRPIQQRLRKLHPALNDPDLDAYERACREAMEVGEAMVFECLTEAGRDGERAFALWAPRMLARFPWISEENLTHTFSQGCYFAWKDGAL